MELTAPSRFSYLTAFYHSTVGKKVIMGVTGVILVGFVVSHMLGNILVFQGADKLDAYSAFLRSTGKLLWIARAVLLVAVILHIDAAWKLTRRARAARHHDYRTRRPQASTWGARTMRWGGVLLLVFIVYHLLHLTFGVVHPDAPHFNHETVNHNVVTGFQALWVVVFYELAMVALGLHLYHGTAAMILSLGGSHPRYTPAWRKVATAIAVLTAVGFMAIPLAVYFGWVR